MNLVFKEKGEFDDIFMIRCEVEGTRQARRASWGHLHLLLISDWKGSRGYKERRLEQMSHGAFGA